MWSMRCAVASKVGARERSHDPSEMDPTGALPAIVAAEFGQLSVLQVLGAHGVGLRAQDARGMTCAHAAGLGGHLAVLEFVVGPRQQQKGARGDGVAWAQLQDKKGKTCGHYAAERGHIAVLEYLVLRGVDLTATDQSGATVAHLASYFGHADVVALLLAHAPELFDVKDVHGAVPRVIAQHRGRAAVLDVFKDKSEL